MQGLMKCADEGEVLRENVWVTGEDVNECAG